MDEEALRRLWWEWATAAVPGPYGPQRDAVEAALAAIRAGADRAQAVAAARAAVIAPAQGRVYSPPIGQSPDPAGAVPARREILPDILPPPVIPLAAPTPVPVVTAAAATPPGPDVAPPAVVPVSPPLRLVDRPFVLPGAIGLVTLLLIAAVVVFAFGGATSTSQSTSGSADDVATSAALVVGHWGSYHARITLHSGKGGGEVKYSSSTSVSVSATKADAHVQVVTTGSGTFISANAAFYTGSPVLAQHAADRWLNVKDATGFLSPLASAPSVGASCMLVAHGTLRKGGSTTVGGRHAVEIDDAGDMPGTTPAKLFIATDGTADLLRVDETGVTNGTANPQCSEGFGRAVTDRSQLATVDFDQINGHFDISAPTDVLNLDDPPFCGTPVSLNLSAAAQQFLLLLYDSDTRSAQIEKECGCPDPTFDEVHKAMLDEVANDTSFEQGVMALPLNASQRAVADQVVAAYRPLIANEVAQANAGSFVQAQAFYAADGQLSQAAGTAARALHAALGVPPDVCSFDAPS